MFCAVRAVEVHRLRIEPRREGLDVLGGNEVWAGLDDLADGEILVAARAISVQPASGREAEMHDVAVGDDVVLAFEAKLAGIARAGFAAELDVIVIGDGLGADEAALEIGVDDAGRLRRPRACG